MKFLFRGCVAFLMPLFLFSIGTSAQFLMDVTDTTNEMRISGYFQPQFQYIQEKGAKTYSGGDFPDSANTRFTLRRGRLRFDYSRVYKDQHPFVYVVFQFDGTERGVFIRDFWGRVFENKFRLFSCTVGMFARPFGYELNLSSSDRETPERGRMSQILMKSERDLGAMITLAPGDKDHFLHQFELDAGFFNGQGLTATNDFDSYKDFIARASFRRKSAGSLLLSGGLSYFNGGFLQNSRYLYKVHSQSGGKGFYADSSLDNVGGKAPRKYYGVDGQVRLNHGDGYTEFRAEYWQGIQTALLNATETPGTLPSEPYYIRNFNGAFFYLIHNFDKHNQLAIKFDWYDPNTDVGGSDIGRPGANINEANIRYNTLGFGYSNYLNTNLKIVLWYDVVTNEKTQLPSYSNDLRDHVFTVRLQFRF